MADGYSKKVGYSLLTLDICVYFIDEVNTLCAGSVLTGFSVAITL